MDGSQRLVLDYQIALEQSQFGGLTFRTNQVEGEILSVESQHWRCLQASPTSARVQRQGWVSFKPGDDPPVGGSLRFTMAVYPKREVAFIPHEIPRIVGSNDPRGSGYRLGNGASVSGDVTASGIGGVWSDEAKLLRGWWTPKPLERIGGFGSEGELWTLASDWGESTPYQRHNLLSLFDRAYETLAGVLPMRGRLEILGLSPSRFGGSGVSHPAPILTLDERYMPQVTGSNPPIADAVLRLAYIFWDSAIRISGDGRVGVRAGLAAASTIAALEMAGEVRASEEMQGALRERLARFPLWDTRRRRANRAARPLIDLETGAFRETIQTLGLDTWGKVLTTREVYRQVESS